MQDGYFGCPWPILDKSGTTNLNIHCCFKEKVTLFKEFKVDHNPNFFFPNTEGNKKDLISFKTLHQT